MTTFEGHGGDQVAEVLQRSAIDRIYTLSGGHVFPIYDGLHTRGMRIIDTRHEQAAAFAAEAHGKLTRQAGVAVLTAGPGVVNGMNPIVSARFNGSPLVVIGGRAPQVRWGQGSLQEMDHVPLVASTTKHAETVFDTAAIGERTAHAIATAQARHRGPVFLDVPMDTLFTRGDITPAALPSQPSEAIEGDLDEAARLLADAERPVLVLGGDVWADGAEGSARSLAEAQRLPVIANGMGRGILPADHVLAFSQARGAAFKQADLVIVAGTALDFRLGFGRFGDAAVIHVVDSPDQVGAHASPKVALAGPIAASLDALAQASRRDRGDWVATLREHEDASRGKFAGELADDRAPLHPARIYADLVPRLARDGVVIADGGDFASYAGKFVDVYEPGGWLDPGPYGCLGISAGYALAAGLLHPGRQIVVLLGDGAAGFSIGDWDSLIRHGVNVTFVCGNNGIWGLEKHPMRFLYGYDVAAELRPETRYDEVMRALGGHGSLVRTPAELGPALDAALAFEGPSLVNVVTDPEVAYPRSANLA